MVFLFFFSFLFTVPRLIAVRKGWGSFMRRHIFSCPETRRSLIGIAEEAERQDLGKMSKPKGPWPSALTHKCKHCATVGQINKTGMAGCNPILDFVEV